MCKPNQIQHYYRPYLKKNSIFLNWYDGKYLYFLLICVYNVILNGSKSVQTIGCLLYTCIWIAIWDPIIKREKVGVPFATLTTFLSPSQASFWISIQIFPGLFVFSKFRSELVVHFLDISWIIDHQTPHSTIFQLYSLP